MPHRSLLTKHARSEASLLAGWAKELEKWCERVPLVVFHQRSKAARERDLRTLADEDGDGGVCLTTYGMVKSSLEQLKAVEWDYVVLDEGHQVCRLLKRHNFSLKSKAHHGVRSKIQQSK